MCPSAGAWHLPGTFLPILGSAHRPRFMTLPACGVVFSCRRDLAALLAPLCEAPPASPSPSPSPSSPSSAKAAAPTPGGADGGGGGGGGDGGAGGASVAALLSDSEFVRLCKVRGPALPVLGGAQPADSEFVRLHKVRRASSASLGGGTEPVTLTWGEGPQRWITTAPTGACVPNLGAPLLGPHAGFAGAAAAPGRGRRRAGHGLAAPDAPAAAVSAHAAAGWAATTLGHTKVVAS